MLPFPLPAGLTAQASLGEPWSGWLDRLPRLAAEAVADWDLVYDGDPWHGFRSLVLPVRTAEGQPAVLKVALPDDESEHEHLALQHWHGNGAVRLLRADPRRRAMLLERLRRQDLSDEWDLRACEVVGDLYARLHVPAPPQLRPLTALVERWRTGLAGLPNDAPVPRRLVEQALSLSASLVADTASTGTMVHADLHYGNVLAADRQPWLVIDPKPVSGDPHYEPAPMLWNRWEDVVASGRVRDAVRRRFHMLVDTACLDEDRARGWVVVRAVHNAYWSVDDARRRRRPFTEAQRRWITTMVTIAKAVQD